MIARGTSPSLARSRAEALLNGFGLAERTHVAARRLSGGERQRLAVIRALGVRAQLILADEPTASLDRGAVMAVAAALRVCADEGALVLIATHDVAVGDQCDQTIGLEELNKELLEFDGKPAGTP
jgi:ABC-type lipoprotein export system ATPase subunit